MQGYSPQEHDTCSNCFERSLPPTWMIKSRSPIPTQRKPEHTKRSTTFPSTEHQRRPRNGPEVRRLALDKRLFAVSTRQNDLANSKAPAERSPRAREDLPKTVSSTLSHQPHSLSMHAFNVPAAFKNVRSRMYNHAKLEQLHDVHSDTVCQVDSVT